MKQTILILHGWGLHGSLYNDLKEELQKKNYIVYSIDLPGFGDEPLPSDKYNLDSYVEFVNKFLQSKKIEKVILLGHSFGGRIAVKYTWKYPQKVSKLILTGVPVIRNMTVKKKIAFVVATIGGKIVKIFPKNIQQFTRKVLYFAIGEWDYYKAGKLKQVFRNIIGEDLVQYVKEIKTPTLLVWGIEDKLTPVKDTDKIQHFMPQAIAVKVPQVGHRLPISHPHEFITATGKFI